ncbi:MAG: hypothetical protein JST68_07740, partial [Bacteroidetes bacterium]|nr:hypothetical protein [Bacteroidota bacterium]
MSINNIELQDFIVGELYKDALLFTPGSAPAVQRPAPQSTPTQTTPPEAPRPAQTTSPQTTQPAPPPAAKPVQPTPAPAAQPAPAQSAQSAQPITTYKFLGNHRRGVTILVNAPGSPFLPDNQLNFLSKILEACRLNLGDVAIVNHASAPINISDLHAQLQPKFVLLFGLEPSTIRLPINFPVFRPQPFDSCTYLSAPGLELMVQNSEDSKLLKSKLWVCLKSM